MHAKHEGGIGQAALNYHECMLHEPDNQILAFCPKDSVWKDAFMKQAVSNNSRMACKFLDSYRGPKGLVTWWQMRRCLTAFKPDVVISHNFHHMNVYAAKGIAPVVAPAHMYKFKQFNKLDGVIMLTQDMYNTGLQHGVKKEKMHIIPNAVETISYQPPMRDSFRDPVVIGAIGRVGHEKRFDRYIDMLVLLRQKRVPFKGLIAGEGAHKEELEQRVVDLGMSEQVTFLGHVWDKTAFFEQVDMVVMPSQREPFGLVVLEAWQHAVPIVTSDAGSFKELIDDKYTGMLTTGEPEDLLEAVQYLIQDPARAHAIARQGRQKLMENYTTQSVGKQLMEYMQHVVA